MRRSGHVNADTGASIPVAASDFPGETFRVLKEKETKQFGHYRTRRLVLEAWGRLTNDEGTKRGLK